MFYMPFLGILMKNAKDEKVVFDLYPSLINQSKLCLPKKDSPKKSDTHICWENFYLYIPTLCENA